MPKPVNELRRSTLLLLMAAFFIGYFTSIWIMGQARAIEVGNMMLFSFAIGIVVAYTPDAWEVAKSPRLDGATVISFGIWIGWLSISYRTGGAILWRYFDKPDGWLDSALWGLHIAGTSSSAVAHLWGPEAIAGRVPRREWIRFGILIAAGLMIALVLTLLDD